MTIPLPIEMLIEKCLSDCDPGIGRIQKKENITFRSYSKEQSSDENFFGQCA
jgi:hypothetical protein